MDLVRYVTPQVEADLQKKMVFVGGARQVGKTTMARRIAGDMRAYLNWDVAEDRERILKRELPTGNVWVFDEIHKYRAWRNYLKGVYDADRNTKKPHRILVTGSARLDYYRYGGDSLQGRYHYLRMHPLSVGELKMTSNDHFGQLLQLGGFPEPFFGQSELEARRWSREYRSRLVRDELTTIEHVHDLGQLELLMLRLPDLVGSPLSVNAVREDLQISHKTVSRWLEILERLYAIFRVPPFGTPRIRAVKKEQKHYHLDWTVVADMALRFENAVACHLLKWVHFEQDARARDLELRYFRDVDGREVDFVILENRKPIQLIECKWKDATVSPSLKYMKERFPACEAWQLLATGKKDFVSPDGIRVCPAVVFLRTLT